MTWMAYKSQEQRDFEQSRSWPLPISTDRFINSLFTDASHLSKPDREKLLSELHTIASDMQDVELNVSLYDIFTDEEQMAVYELNNRRMTLQNGDEIENNGIAARPMPMLLSLEKVWVLIYASDMIRISIAC